MKNGKWIVILALIPSLAYAADFEATLTSLVTAVLGRIMPIFALYHCGETALAFAQDKPEAKDKAKTVAIGVVALLGVNAVWAFLRAQLK
ncbi:MAG: hypothetical protein A2428_15545 [Bdellovibrionales bacterium RIFOXYC1_FULL_54_43]|nr:MAG: hypothetical protein A2428_15545 [Bdellovibrionales bacterium RIFOXYC1_FULL_54_43]OFZ84781.1 MAG: hypothetical protein A2603_05365 [Bdellovibrionales bacterium RIFOXYD1_FULL_55_31]